MESEYYDIDPNNPDLAYLPAVVAEFEKVAAHFYHTIELMRAALHLPPIPPDEPDEYEVPF